MCGTIYKNMKCHQWVGTHPETTLRAAVWRGRSAPALPAAGVGAVGMRSRSPSAGMRWRGWGTSMSDRNAPRTRAGNRVWGRKIFSQSGQKEYFTCLWTQMTTYPDFDRERDLDSECLDSRDGLVEPELLSDLAWVWLPCSDLDENRDPCCHCGKALSFTLTCIYNMKTFLNFFKGFNTLNSVQLALPRHFTGNIQWICHFCI